MNSINIWKKISKNRKEEKVSNGIINRRQFKKPKKKSFGKFSKNNFRTNWIENEGDDEQSDSSSSLSIDADLFDQKCQIKTNDDDDDDDDDSQDSLELENLQYLSTMTNILFLDLDNFSRFFQHLTKQLPNQTYVIAFQGSTHQWELPKKNLIFENLFNSNHFHLMHRSGTRHDAADFALVLTFGKLHGLLPKSIPFTIISGDQGFIEIIHQLKYSLRRINWFNPHLFSLEDFNQILNLTSTH